MKSKGYREVCIFLAGSTPQVITETLYALAVKDPPIFTDEIYIITTAKGKQASEDTLIGKGVLDNLAEEYGMPRINLTDSSYLIPADGFGNPLQDIRDEQDNERMGDLITEFLRERSSDPAVRIHCSLAGGRKTMSF
jgi:CRISPR-associated protein (TIGR02584 family)